MQKVQENDGSSIQLCLIYMQIKYMYTAGWAKNRTIFGICNFHNYNNKHKVKVTQWSLFVPES